MNAEEQKPEETPTPTPEAKTVEMTQAEFDSKFNTSFGKGATKATNDILEALGVENLDTLKGIVKAKSDAEEADKTELVKAQEALDASKSVNSELANKYEKLEQSNKINTLANKHGVKDAEYLAFKYAQAQTVDGFSEDAFIEEFMTGNPNKATPTDNTPNKGVSPGKDLSKMSYKELMNYQNSL